MPQTALQQQSLERIVKRVSKKLDLPAPKVVLQPAIPCFEIGLLQTEDSSVEQAAASWLAEPDAPVYYVENTLLNGLFALLCWPVLFAPLEGAFFHPFHAGPADLVREGFVERRHSLFEDCLALLESGDYRREILQTYSSKQGISCTFIRWPMFGQEVVETALECIPAIHLSLYFRRILADIKNNRAGLPDLIQFWPDQKRYRLIEVKGPGDNLQDNQRRWFYFCLQRNLPIALCKVKWV